MRQSQKNNSQSRSASRSKSRSLSNSQIQSKHYFCHFKNAMYMGGMKSFQRNGYGLIIHDNGASIFCSHYIDFRHGHSLVFYDNCFMSMMHDKNKLTQCTVRFPNYLIFLKYNKDSQIDGKGLLLDYQKRQITYLFYKRGILNSRKQQKEYSIINRVFDLDNLQFLIGITHSRALKYQIDDNQYISCFKTPVKLSIGFSKRNILNGLGFTLIHKESNSHQSQRSGNSFYLKPLQRGYFQNAQLTGMGEKWFKNGNYYIGEFKDNIFQGKGILKNSAKNNWVYGNFSKGNMTQLIEYSNEGDSSKYTKLVQQMHQRKSSWINKQIIIQTPDMFQKQINEIVNNKSFSNIKSLQQRKKQVLKKIQQNFLCDDTNFLNFNAINSNYNSPQRQKHKLVRQENQYQTTSPQNQMQRTQKQNGNDQLLDTNKKMNSIQQKTYQIQSQKETKTIYKIKLLDIPKTSDKTQKKQNSCSPSKSQKSKVSKLNFSQKSMGFSQIKQQSPQFQLDSKRLIGRSRIFKYTDPHMEQQPPTFNYVPMN